MTRRKAQAEALQRLFKLHLIREIEANRETAQEQPILLLPKTEEGIDKGNDDLIVNYKTWWVACCKYLAVLFFVAPCVRKFGRLSMQSCCGKYQIWNPPGPGHNCTGMKVKSSTMVCPIVTGVPEGVNGAPTESSWNPKVF